MKLVAGKKAVLLGLGVAGMATLQFLQKKGVQVTVSEQRNFEEFSVEEQAACSKLQLETGGHSEDFIFQADCVVPSPGVPLDLPVLRAAREKALPIIGELDLAADELTVPVIGVTGSNGKTTVTALIGEIIRQSGFYPFVGGNIGTPLLSALLGDESYDVLVLELSSFQLDLAEKFRPTIGLLLNLSPDHLDRHGTMAQYGAAKRRMFANQQPVDTAILGGDDSLVMAYHGQLKGNVRTFGFGMNNQARIIGSCIRVAGDAGEVEFSLTGTALDSRVNRLNAAAALLAAQAFGCSAEGIRAGLNGFVPPAHRMQFVTEINGVRFINDSKATNVGAMVAALESCDPGIVLLAGGRDKGGDFAALRDLIKKKVSLLLCLGEAADMLKKAFADVVAVERVLDMQAAVSRAVSAAEPGQTVLLAPGCASFDMFSGYAERGKIFMECVQEVKKRSKGEKR